MRITKQAERGVSVEYSLQFGQYEERTKGVTLCAGFPCDEHGNIFPLEHEAAKKNLAECLAGHRPDGTKLYPLGVKRYEHRYYFPPEGECNRCKRTVVLEGFTNTCECGADYNSSGQELAPRSQWGEETGETAADILSGPEWDDDY